MTAIVKPNGPREEEWFMLATSRLARPGWRILAARRNEYRELPSAEIPPSQSRTEALAKALAWAEKNPKSYPGHMLIPINLSLAAIDEVESVSDEALYVPMWPKRMPLCSNATEARERIVITRGKDKEFAAKWARFRFIPVRVDDCPQLPG